MPESLKNGSMDSTPPSVDRARLNERGLTGILFGHAAFRYLHAGCELHIFELLARTPSLAAADLARQLDLAPRAAQCLLLGLTSLGLLEKGDDGRYSNGPLVARFIQENRWDLVHDTARFEAEIVYPGLHYFLDSIRADDNLGLKHVEGTGDLYRRLARDPNLETTFFRYMSTWSKNAMPRLLENFDFDDCRRVLDLGCGDGTNAIEIARKHPHLRMILLDVPDTARIARKRVAEAKLGDRVEVISADFFNCRLPTGCDCVLLIHELVIWPMEANLVLLQRVHEALEPGGRVVIFNSISDDDGRGPLMAALDSAYFVTVPHAGGMIHPWSEYRKALEQAGFHNIRSTRCESWTPHGLIVAEK